MTLAALLQRNPQLFLDFDGPMCAVFTTISSYEAARRLAATMAAEGVPMPRHVREAGDPFDVLRHIASAAPQHLASAEHTLTELELAGVAGALPTTHLRAMLRALRATGHTVTVVSNNSAAAVHSFVRTQLLNDYIHAVVARTSPDPQLLKPHPHLLTRAVIDRIASPANCVLLGDSVTDIQAAHRAGTSSIAYANKPRKRDQLTAAGPDALISNLAEVVAALAP